MNERLTIQNLVDLLVSRHGVPQKDADVCSGVFSVDRTGSGE